jgi:S1-C subfamily serine protease
MQTFNDDTPTLPPWQQDPAEEPAAQSTTATATATPAFPPPFGPYDPPRIVTYRAQRPWWQPALILVLVVMLLGTGLGVGIILSNRANTEQALTTTSGASVTTTSGSSVTLPTTVQDLQQTIITVTQRTEASVVEVTSTNSAGQAIGSGEFLTKDGYIVTNDHVVAGYTSYIVTLSDGTTKTAQLIGEDAQDDLAVLKVTITNATPITFADSSQAQVGEFVLAIGTPLGLQETTTLGIVSATNRAEEETTTSNAGTTSAGPVLAGLIQTSAAINPGNSGGALVNLQGQLVGIPTLGASSTSSGETVSGIGFAIPANRVVYVVNQLMQSGHLTSTNQGFLGIQGQDVSSSTQQGVLVQGFAQDTAGGSPAETGGIKTGDLITAINGKTITDSVDLAGAVLTQTPGTAITVTVQRGTSQLRLTVTLGQRPVA